MMISLQGSARSPDPAAGQSPHRQRRRGSLLAEVAMSGVLLMIAMGITVKVLGWVSGAAHGIGGSGPHRSYPT